MGKRMTALLHREGRREKKRGAHLFTHSFPPGSVIMGIESTAVLVVGLGCIQSTASRRDLMTGRYLSICALLLFGVCSTMSAAT
jgi:hypothetical protein